MSLKQTSITLSQDVSSKCSSLVPHLQVGVLSVRPLRGERQIQKVHQVVVAISNGFKVVVCLDNLQDPESHFIKQTTQIIVCTINEEKDKNKSINKSMFTIYEELQTPTWEKRFRKESSQGKSIKAGKGVKRQEEEKRVWQKLRHFNFVLQVFKLIHHTEGGREDDRECMRSLAHLFANYS